MGSNFNPHILVEKLSKLNSSQQSIETLSHWCIFHMNKAKQVVETWDRQFHCAPREQRLAFLYLANDILQNSRRKGADFVSEFWKVLPESLCDMMENGDEFGKKAALRLMNIWEDRKVFGSRGPSLKEECAKRQLDNGSRNWKHAASKLKSPGGKALDKLHSGYEAVIQLDEDAILSRCRNAISFYEKVDKDLGGDYRLDHMNNELSDELKGQHAILRDCVEKLTVVESCRANLVSFLQEALREEEYKLNQARDQLQVAQMHSEQASSICRQLFSGVHDSASSQIPKNHFPTSTTLEQSSPSSVMYTQQMPSSVAEKEDDPKSAAAAVAEQLAASKTSQEMLTYVLSSLASDGVIGSNSHSPPEKRAKTQHDHTIESYTPPLPPQTMPNTSQDPSEPPPPPLPPSSPPPLPPLPPPLQPPYQYLPIPNGPYGYGMGLVQQPVVPGYVPPATSSSPFAPPSNATYQAGGYTTEGGGFYGQPPQSLPAAPMGQQ